MDSFGRNRLEPWLMLCRRSLFPLSFPLSLAGVLIGPTNLMKSGLFYMTDLIIFICWQTCGNSGHLFRSDPQSGGADTGMGKKPDEGAHPTVSPRSISVVWGSFDAFCRICVLDGVPDCSHSQGWPWNSSFLLKWTILVSNERIIPPRCAAHKASKSCLTATVS